MDAVDAPSFLRVRSAPSGVSGGHPEQDRPLPAPLLRAMGDEERVLNWIDRHDLDETLLRRVGGILVEDLTTRERLAAERQEALAERGNSYEPEELETLRRDTHHFDALRRRAIERRDSQLFALLGKGAALDFSRACGSRIGR